METLQKLWSLYLVNILDILIVAYLLYQLMLVIKGTRAVQILIGVIVLLFATFFVKYVLHFPTLSWLLTYFWVPGVVILAVVFQPELRAALAQLGSQQFARLLITHDFSFIEEIISAIRQFSETRTGALIVLEQETGLREYIESGTVINGEVTNELLQTVFNTKAVLHDGAVIIQNNRLIAAGCLLPLSDEKSIAKILGTRHRAAIGLSEITDAYVIVVSEETGTVSLAHNSKLEREVDLDKLKEKLYNLYRKRNESKSMLTNIKKTNPQNNAGA
ncbi:MAG: diadenylate cyclase CdaA [Elusimicrobiota bacterium]